MRYHKKPKRHRNDEVWCLRKRIRELEGQLVTAREIKHEGSLEAIVKEVKEAMKQFGDKQWLDRKKELLNQLWSHDYSQPLLGLHSLFPLLADLIYKLILDEYRLKKLAAPGNEEKRAKYDHSLQLQVEAMLNNILRCCNQNSKGTILHR